MNPVSHINMRIARKGLAIALVLFLGLGTAVSGAASVSCENGGPCLDCMAALFGGDKHMDDHMPVSQGCSSDIQGSSCSLDNFDTAVHRQAAVADTDFQSSDTLPPAGHRIDPASAHPRHPGFPLLSGPPGPIIPIYLKTLSFLC